MFQRAQRKSAKLRLALMGPSGSGKTYGSLLIAHGLGGQIAMLDSERGSGEIYSDLCEYDVLQIQPPYLPERYVTAIKTAERMGYTTLIIDSLSHAWAGVGGLLDAHDKATKATRNSFTAWREVTPMHNGLVDAILQSSMHIIATLRTKTAYDIVNENGKMKPVKIGLSPVFRDGIEYEFTAVFDLSVEGHVATSSKDRTGLFDGRFFTPSEETGESLLKWINSGQPAVAHKAAA